ncbi:MAG TPA: DUF1440 domain-containing protein [Bryobacteraceae bacterium]|jgi:hypothetical protein
MFFKKRKENMWLNMAAGAMGGLLGSWTMNRFQSGLAKLESAGKPPEQTSQAQDGQASEEPATVKAGEQISEAVTGRVLTTEKKKVAEPLVHYAFGALVGAFYGALASRKRLATAGMGACYGAGVWLLADEIAVPAAGLSKGPLQVPLKKHLEALAAHLVYGVTTEGVRRMAMARKAA